MSGRAAGAPDDTPTVGSANNAVADPRIVVPRTTPCVVPLYANLAFNDFSPKLFPYAPPAGCSGPWAKVVLAADFEVEAGRQFDRTASIWIGGTNVYFGTTQEPSRTVAPTWHIENDLTDYSVLFRSAQPGMVQLDNLVNETFTSTLHGSAELRFYPLARHGSAPASADVVLPLSNGPTGGTVGLATTQSVLARTFTLPTNIERAVLDVYAQSQSGDEFWFTCVPDALTGPLQSCGGTSFREAEIAIDGRPAGVAPVYPWLFTGAIDPLLWRPIPSVQTLNFVPYRVDLTPFAGVLSDGKPHEVSISVFGANNFFATTASLLLYLDRHATRVRGAVTANTLVAVPTPTVTTNITTADDGRISGPVNVLEDRKFRIAGYVDTSHGRVFTEVETDLRFSSRQQFDITDARYQQHIVQNTAIRTRTTTLGLGGLTVQRGEQEWPLDLDFVFAVNPDGTQAQTTTVDQKFERTDTTLLGGWWPLEVRTVSNHVSPTDTRLFDANGVSTGSTGQASRQRYFSADSRGGCYSREIVAAAGVLTSVVDGEGCGR